MTLPCLHRAWERFLSLLPIFAIVSVAAVWLLSALSIGRLGGSIPIHFDAAGNPNEAIDASLWWTLPAIGTGIVALMGGVLALVRWLVKRHPESINVPRKADFVRLSPEARARITPRMGQLVMGIALISNLILLAVVRDTYRIATHELTQLAVWKLFACLGLMLVWTIVGTVRIRNAIKREANGNPPLVLGTTAPL